jgi:hypothetical protein
MVKAMKRAMKAIMEKADLTDEEFRTLVYVVADRLNDRPIASVGDKDDLVTLKPNDFLMSYIGNTYFPPDYPEENRRNVVTRWQYIQMLKGHFCERFAKEVVPMLRPRKKWTREKENISVGDVCTEFDENSPRLAWRLLRVTKVHPSDDGLVRKVEVTNAGGKLYERAISRLIPIVQD